MILLILVTAVALILAVTVGVTRLAYGLAVRRRGPSVSGVALWMIVGPGLVICGFLIGVGFALAGAKGQCGWVLPGPTVACPLGDVVWEQTVITLAFWAIPASLHLVTSAIVLWRITLKARSRGAASG
jgi:hypothetical protein